MSRAKTALSCLIVAASIGCAPALAAQDAQGVPGALGGGPVAAMQKEDPPQRLESVALRQDVSRPPPRAAQAGNDGRKEEQWLRLPESGTMPEPGLWALLLAGFLGICAVARPRIFSS